MSGTIIARRTGQAPLRVRGEVIASNASSMNNASPSYSGGAGVSQSVRVIRTASAKYVVEIHYRTIWQGAHDTDDAAVFPTVTQAVDYLSGRVPAWMLAEIVEELGEEANAGAGL